MIRYIIITITICATLICMLWSSDFSYPIKMHIASLYYTNIYIDERKILNSYLHTIATGDTESIVSILYDKSYFVGNQNIINTIRKLLAHMDIDTLKLFIIQKDTYNEDTISIAIFLDNDTKKIFMCHLKQRNGKWLLGSISMSDALAHAAEKL